jgi:hypothetical protein
MIPQKKQTELPMNADARRLNQELQLNRQDAMTPGKTKMEPLINADNSKRRTGNLKP